MKFTASEKRLEDEDLHKDLIKAKLVLSET